MTWGVDSLNQTIWILLEIGEKPFGVVHMYGFNDDLVRSTL